MKEKKKVVADGWVTVQKKKGKGNVKGKVEDKGGVVVEDMGEFVAGEPLLPVEPQSNQQQQPQPYYLVKQYQCLCKHPQKGSSSSCILCIPPPKKKEEQIEKKGKE